MDERTLHILEAVIKDFIETGEPVSSVRIYRKYKFDVKPATIRNELHALAERAFLEQPHTSGGRIPTDKGYRFFVERVFADIADQLSESAQEAERAHEALTKEHVKDVIAKVADALHVVGVGYAPDSGVVKIGLNDLLNELIAYHEVATMQDVASVVRDIETLDERIPDMLHLVGDGLPRVFIGKSPITRSPHLSVIADHMYVDGRPFVLAAIGSKRMDYENNIRFFMNLKSRAY